MARARKGRAPAPRARPLLALAFLAVLLLLASTAEERTFGCVADEEQMVRTAVALAEFGEIGIARGAFFTIHRPAGDAVSPYGMGQPLVEVPAAFLANGWERRFGEGSSQTLFVGLEVLLVALAALGAALAARALGAPEGGVLVALFGAAFGSPLWVYAAAGYSEPLQAAALVFALLSALRAAEPGPRASGWAVAAGACGGIAVLAKGLNVVLVPFLLLPMLVTRATPSEGPPVAKRESGVLGRLVAAAAGFLPPFAAFLAFEVVRFGRPFASYGGQGFTHPPLDGLWRLLVGVNKGLLWYFPLVIASAAGLVLLAKRSRAAAVAIAAPSLLLLALSSAWWAWDGTVGWGPRLLVPLVPLLAAAAGVAASGAWRRPAQALLAAGVVLNALGVLQAPSATAAYLAAIPPATLAPEETRRFPAEFLEPLPGGGARIDRQHLLAGEAALAPFRVHAFLLAARLGAGSPAELERRLASPPWGAARPDLVPKSDALPSASAVPLVAYGHQPFAWPHLFAASPRPRDERADAFNAAWDQAVADQLLRALDVGRNERAVALGERLLERSPSGYSAALYAEALRASGRRETLAGFLATVPPQFRTSPSLGVVEALAARDAGDEASARRILAAVARVFPRPALVAALEKPLAEWPAGLHAMTGENRSGSRVGAPAVGGR